MVPFACLFASCARHVTWTPTLFHGESPSSETWPTARVLLLTGLLRGLWEIDPHEAFRYMDIFLPDRFPILLVGFCQTGSYDCFALYASFVLLS